MRAHGIGNHIRPAGMARGKYEFTVHYTGHFHRHLSDPLKNALRRQGCIAGADKYAKPQITVALDGNRPFRSPRYSERRTLSHSLTSRGASRDQDIHQVCSASQIPYTIDALLIR
jgi:hypothetical protein